MLKKRRTVMLLRKFSQNPKFALMAPLNTFVPPDLIYLTHLKRSQNDLLSFIGTEEILTSYLPTGLKDREFNRNNMFDVFLDNADAKFKETYAQSQKEVQEFRKKQSDNQNPDFGQTLKTDETKKLRREYPRVTKNLYYALEKHVAFDQNLHNIINNYNSHDADVHNQLTSAEIQTIIDNKTIGTMSRLENYFFNEGKFKGRMSRLEGKSYVKILKSHDSSNFDLQTWLTASVKAKIKNYDENISTMRKVNNFNNSGITAIQHSIESLKNKLDLESPDYLFKDEQKIWQRLDENNFKIVEYTTVPDTQKFVNALNEDEYKFFITSLIRINESLKNLMNRTGHAVNFPIKDINDGVERSAAASYLNGLIALFLSKQIISNNELFYIMLEDDLLVKSEFLTQTVKQFVDAYLTSWKICETKEKQSKNDSKESDSQADLNEMYEKLKSFYEDEQSPSKKNLIEKVTHFLKKTKLCDIIKQTISEELSRFSELNDHDGDYQNCKSYLELILKLPFGKFSKDQTNISHAQKILESSHYGMDDVKNRILEFLAIGKLRGNMINKKIICLLGPPGVGKTSISKSIADCLERKFVRVSLGGESDVAVIKGHRRTYLGSYPGKIVNALKIAGTENPVILLDEIDKVSERGVKGNVQDVLLEILDPAQNHSFYDHYLDMPIDLSNVLFLCSANILDSTTITGALYDRMEIIEVSGYTKQEKQSIFTKHLLPKLRKKIGLESYNVQVEFSDEIIEKIINDYAREPGVRNLEKNLQKIFEKIAFDFLQKNKNLTLQTLDSKKETETRASDYPIVKYHITTEAVKEFLGPKVYFSQTIFHQKEDLIGFAFGLGYNGYGGSVLSIEVLEIPHLNEEAKSKALVLSNILNIENIVITKQSSIETTIPENSNKDILHVGDDTIKQDGSLIITGSLGNIMKESVEIAYSFAKFYLYKISKNNNYLENKNLHIHFPEGASKKDGPSAGITIVTSLISAAIKIPYRPEFAMTGEISLNGKVLKIGGLREKVLAAKREGITNIIVPRANTGDIEEMKSDVKDDVNFHLVENYDEVYGLIFGFN